MHRLQTLNSHLLSRLSFAAKRTLRKPVSATLTVCLIVVSLSTALGKGDKHLKQEFKALYSKQTELSKKRDVKALMEMNTPEYYVKLLSGDRIGRPELEAGMNDFFTSGKLIRQISLSYTVLEVTMKVSEAIVLVAQKDNRIQLWKDGKIRRVNARVIHRDTWIQTPAGWRRGLTVELQTKFTVDGKPVKTIPQP